MRYTVTGIRIDSTRPEAEVRRDVLAKFQKRGQLPFKDLDMGKYSVWVPPTAVKNTEVFCTNAVCSVRYKTTSLKMRLSGAISLITPDKRIFKALDVELRPRRYLWPEVLKNHSLVRTTTSGFWSKRDPTLSAPAGCACISSKLCRR